MNLVKKNSYIYHKINQMKELLTFTRGQDPKDAMHTGIQSVVESWLNNVGITKYELIKEGDIFLINIKDSNFSTVDLSSKLSSQIPDYIHFNHIKVGGFYCSHNKLTTLKGVPRIINGGFLANDNLLETIDFGPEIVEGHYIIDNNKLTSLNGLPKEINTLAINNNLLTSLKGCPEVINGDLFCHDNKLNNLEFLPKKITGSLFISYTEEFKMKYDINDKIHNYAKLFIEEINSKCTIDENIKII